MSCQNAGMELLGVGLGYHPLLHNTALSRRNDYDFVEIPYELYLDPARSALLDPQQERLRQIIASGPCAWRGDGLSLGSVERAEDPAFDARLIERMKRLVERGGFHCCESMGFHRLADRDIGLPQDPPPTPAAAAWIAARHGAARRQLGRPLLLQPCATASTARGARDAAEFLGAVVSIADCRFVVDVSDWSRLAQRAEIDAVELAERLPHRRIGLLAVSGEREEDWALASALLRQGAAKAIVIRRTGNFFPLDAVLGALRRARDLLSQIPDAAPAPDEALPALLPGDPASRAELRAYQSQIIESCLDPTGVSSGLSPAASSERAALAADVQSWRAWRERVEDIHKAQQIARFMAQSR